MFMLEVVDFSGESLKQTLFLRYLSLYRDFYVCIFFDCVLFDEMFLCLCIGLSLNPGYFLQFLNGHSH
jgi:hypothetical protein